MASLLSFLNISDRAVRTISAVSQVASAAATIASTIDTARTQKKVAKETSRANRAIEAAEQKRFALQKQSAAETARRNTISQVRQARALRATGLAKQTAFGGGGGTPSSISTGSSGFAGGVAGSTQSQFGSNQSFLNTQLAIGSAIAEEDENIFGIQTNLNTTTANLKQRSGLRSAVSGAVKEAGSIFTS